MRMSTIWNKIEWSVISDDTSIHFFSDINTLCLNCFQRHLPTRLSKEHVRDSDDTSRKDLASSIFWLPMLTSLTLTLLKSLQTEMRSTAGKEHQRVGRKASRSTWRQNHSQKPQTDRPLHSQQIVYLWNDTTIRVPPKSPAKTRKSKPVQIN